MVANIEGLAGCTEVNRRSSEIFTQGMRKYFGVMVLAKKVFKKLNLSVLGI